MTLLKFIFARSYYFCIKVFKEKEFPQYFAGGVLTLVIFTSLLIILEIIEYVMLPMRINIGRGYHGYIALIGWFTILYYLNKNKRYSQILDDVEKMSDAAKKKLSIISFFYSFFLIIGFFLLGYLLRQYSINH